MIDIAAIVWSKILNKQLPNSKTVFAVIVTAGLGASGVVGAETHTGTGNAYPVADVLKEFQAVCGSVPNFAQADAEADRLGWMQVLEPESTPLAGIIAMMKSREAQNEMRTQGVEEKGMSWRSKSVSGQTLYLAVSSLAANAQGVTINGCRLYDFDDAQGISPDAVSKLIGREPSGSGRDDDATATFWKPGFSPTQPRLELIQVIPDAPHKTIVGSGFALRTNQLQRLGE